MMTADIENKLANSLNVKSVGPSPFLESFALKAKAISMAGILAVTIIGCGGGSGDSQESAAPTTPTPTSPIPAITSNGGGDTATININENETAVTTVVATSSEDINYTIDSRDDNDSFNLNTTTGVLTFKTAPDFEAPTDIGADNGYIVTVIATSTSGAQDNQTINVNIIDISKASSISLSGSGIAENSATNTVVGTLSNNGEDTGTATYSLVSGTGSTDNGLVSIDGTSLKVAGAIDFETNPTLEIRVNVNDGANDFPEAMTITVTDVDEAPPGASITTNMCGSEQTYGTVTNPTTHRTWLDRNLGASRVATSATDHLSYGALFQWGRKSDGHECVTYTDGTTGTATHGTTSTRADAPIEVEFIKTTEEEDWRLNPSAQLWGDPEHENHVCPTGFRLPSKDELIAEIDSWDTNADIAGAFGSVLKLPAPGYRGNWDGEVANVGQVLNYWTSSMDDGKSHAHLIGGEDGSSWTLTNRAYGLSVRCIKY